MKLQEMIAEQGKKVGVASSKVAQLQNALDFAKENLAKEARERERLESLLTVTDGNVLRVHVNFGSQGPRDPEGAFANKKRSGEVNPNARYIRHENGGAAGQDSAHWSGWAEVLYVIPA